MMLYKIGDRVKELWRNCYNDKPIVIIDNIKENKRYRLKYLNVFIELKKLTKY